MHITSTLLWIGIITLLTQLIEALAGFGATAVGLPFAAILLSTGEASAVLNLNAFIVSAVITILKRKEINVKEFKKIAFLILPFLPIGLFIGSSLKAYDVYLKVLLGLVVSFVSLRYFYLAKVKKVASTALKPVSQYIALFSGAVVHGIFATGGPLITLYTTNRVKDKGAFRTTMCAVWTAVNGFVIVCRLLLGTYTKVVYTTSLFTLPFLAVGIFLGMIVHNKIKGGAFTDIVYYLLLAGGFISLYTGLVAIL